MNAKTRILESAAALLAESPTGDISTRTVCEAAGVGLPTLYRHFGDKDALLAAVVDFGFEQYLASKRAAVPSGDPVRDVRDGWDAHVAFALSHPNHYKLMYSPLLSSRPAAAEEAHRMLTAVVERVAAAGLLSLPVPLAAQMIMSANAGVALSLLYRPDINSDPAFSGRVRDAVLAAVTAPAAAGAARRGPEGAPATSIALAAQLRAAPPTALTAAETALLQEWLARLGGSGDTGTGTGTAQDTTALEGNDPS
ncbi:TetR/AcrR family transcriptional regulator [Streptomyces sp. NPDC047002]|uniref:TetR/AcrR family transcriptional regulator n=1 Tax=Streptomyces sp. NPDC047002 TaxID=3155475 RepID=UPI0034542FF5